MINIDELDDQVLSDILENLGYDQDTGEETPEEAYNKVKALSFEEAWAAYCTWNGLMGSFPVSLAAAYESIKKASGKVIIEIELGKEHPDDRRDSILSLKCNGKTIEGEADSMGRADGVFFDLELGEDLNINVVEWHD